MELTQDELRRLLNYDPDTGLFKWKIETCKKVKIGNIAGCETMNSVVITINGKGYYAHILAYLYMKGYYPKNNIKHIDKDKFNNEWNNIREYLKNTKPLTQEELQKKLEYNPDTGIFKWIIGNNINTKPSDIAGCKDFQDYIVININYKQYKAHRLAWLYMEGEFPKHPICHKDKNCSNNRWENLQEKVFKIRGSDGRY